MLNRKNCVPLRPFMRRLILFLSFLGALCAPLRLLADTTQAADELDSTLRVSLLTCSPGSATYELYGHTAIRARSERDRFDVVYNYGLFDFNQPNFVWHFVLGECDYMVGREHFPLFEYAYKLRGSSITEQVLNLYPQEAQELLQALEENCLPENCTYRYNIFRENCTTKARDIIEAHIYGRLRYPMRPRRFTIRQMLHQFTAGSPWDEAGNDMLLGTEVDTLLTERNETFLPIYMMWYADSIMIERGYMRFYPLVAERRVILEANPEVQRQQAASEPSFPLSPTLLFWLLLAAGVLVKKLHIVGREGQKNITDLVIYVVLPCNIITSFLNGMSGDALRDCVTILLISLGIQVFGVIYGKFLYRIYNFFYRHLKIPPIIIINKLWHIA